MNTAKNMFWQFLMLVLCTGSVGGVLLGIGMLLRPERIIALSHFLARWVSPGSKVSEQLDRPRWVERYFYRHHRIVGGLISGGAIFVLYIFLFGYNIQKLTAAVPRQYTPIMNALVALLLIGSVLAALVGLLVLMRPSLLRDIEKSANRWVSTEAAVQKANNMHHHLDDFVMRHRRVAGVIMIIGGAYILYALLPVIWYSQLKF